MKPVYAFVCVSQGNYGPDGVCPLKIVYESLEVEKRALPHVSSMEIISPAKVTILMLTHTHTHAQWFHTRLSLGSKMH